MKRETKIKSLGWIALVAAALLWRQFGPGLPTDTAFGDSGVAELYAHKKSNIMVEFEARVDRILPDDIEPPRHQRFILVLSNGQTVLVTHNLDLSKRVPIQEWALVKVRGEYEYNPQGGVVHWTHRDPGMGTKHGWIEYQGQRYQ